uniref:Uncharacterized protein n=1 Tax=Glossina palpalis gambiensis TaxID=67801 RepID=A0A1B0B6V2_9MUSC
MHLFFQRANIVDDLGIPCTNICRSPKVISTKHKQSSNSSSLKGLRIISQRSPLTVASVKFDETALGLRFDTSGLDNDISAIIISDMTAVSINISRTVTTNAKLTIVILSPNK